MKRTKRTRQAASSSNAPAEDEIELQRRRKEICKWSFALERGIELPHTPRYRKYNSLVRLLGWHKFTETPVKPCIPLVQEFYANLHTSELNKVMVFGEEVWFDEEEINKALGLEYPRNTHDPYQALKDGTTDITEYEVQHTLSLGRGVRKLRNTSTITMGSLSEEARLWRKFITGQILGSTRDGETTKEQQYILFSLLLGKKFNVGRLIYEKLDKMRKTLKKNTFGNMSLSFPSLITILCQNVPRPEDSYVIDTLCSLDRDAVADTDGEVMSTRDFHRQFWGGKGNPAWQLPAMDAAAPMYPQDANESDNGPGDEEEEVPAAVPPQPFMVSAEDWTAMRNALQRQEQDMASINTRMGSIELQMQEMQNAQNTFYQDSRAFYRRFDDRFPPPQ